MGYWYWSDFPYDILTYIDFLILFLLSISLLYYYFLYYIFCFVVIGYTKVVAVQGVLHLGKIKTGLAKATPLAQGKFMHIRSSQHLPAQMDGEPWRQRKGELSITLTDQLVHMTAAV